MRSLSRARLGPVELPEFGLRSRMPELPAELYLARLSHARQRAAARGYDVLIVYADREHSANMAYLTGFDPRFEEAVLILRGAGEPAILVGNECRGTAAAAPLPMRPMLFQDLSLNDQPRDRSRNLEAILRDEGWKLGLKWGSPARRPTRVVTGSRRQPSSSTPCASSSARRAPSRTPRASSTMPPTACAPTTRSSSCSPSSTPPATRPRASSDCCAGSVPA